MLDNIVGGGIAQGSNPIETMRKECFEEAGITEPELSSLQSTGTVTFYYDDPIRCVKDNSRGWQADTEYVFDLELPTSFIPTPQDGEVESFQLLDLNQVLAKLLAREFTMEAAVVTVDFMVRHGFIGVDQDGYDAIVMGCHCNLPFPGPSF